MVEQGRDECWRRWYVTVQRADDEQSFRSNEGARERQQT